MAVVGLSVRTPEVVNNASFVVIFPLTFIANTFVPTNNFPPAAEDLRRLEPGLVGHRGGPRPVRQHQLGAAAAGRLADAAPAWPTR